jgi:YVTN family beta-propeller protein
MRNITRFLGKVRVEMGWITAVGVLALGAPLSGAQLPTGTPRLYITNNAGTTIQVVDPRTNKTIDSELIRDIEVPEDIAFSPDGKRAYITSGSQDVLIVLDRATGKKIKQVPLSGVANQVVATQDGKQILVCIRIIPSLNGPVGRSAPGALDIIDAASLEKIKSIPTKREGLHDIVLTKDGKYAVAGAPEGNAITVYDLKTDQLVWEKDFDMGIMPLALDSAPDGSAKRIFIQLRKLNGFAVVDFATHQEVARVELPKEFTTYKVAYPLYGIRSPSHGMAVSPDGKTLWVNSHTANSVFAYSTSSLELIGRVALPELKVPGQEPIGAIPEWVTMSPDGKTVYVSMSTLKMVYAIDTKTRKEVARIPTGEVPKRMATFVEP